MKNDQRSVAADILSFYSVAQPTSASYIAARSHFTGTNAEKEAKEQSLFKSLFDQVFIGGDTTKNQYPNINYVLNKLGVKSGPLITHQNHFHIKMSVPILKPIITSSSLMAETKGANTMFDFAHNFDNALDNVTVAQVLSQPAVKAKQPNWIGNDENLSKYFERVLKDPEDSKLQFYQYESLGPLGIPRLTVNKTVDYSIDKQIDGKTTLIAQGVGLAKFACVCMDIEAKQAGAWGPECKITKYFKIPEGKLVKNTEPYARDGDYWYTPPRIGTDTARFILENGAGKKVEVIFKLKATSYHGGAIESDTNAQFAELGQVSE